MRRLCFWMIGAVLLCARDVGAQAADTLLKKGARVKMWSSALGYSAKPALFESRMGDSLIIRVPAGYRAGRLLRDTARVSMLQLDRLTVGAQTGITARKGARHGLLWGGVIGGAAGVVGAIMSLPPQGSTACAEAQGFTVCRTFLASALYGSLGGFLFGALGAAIGLPVGFFTGHLMSTRWVDVPTSSSG